MKIKKIPLWNRIHNSGHDLADFRLKTSMYLDYSKRSRSENKEPGKWIQPGQIVKIGKHEIKGGFFYSGGQLAGLDNCTDACLIDPTLRIDSRLPDYSG